MPGSERGLKNEQDAAGIEAVGDKERNPPPKPARVGLDCAVFYVPANTV